MAAVVAASAALLLLPLADAGTSRTQTYFPVADTYTRADEPSVNYGGAVRFSVQESARAARHGLVRFTAGIPRGRLVTSATLRLYAEQGTAAGSVDGGWD